MAPANARVAVVTGVSRGIGRSICQKLATGYVGPLVLYATSRGGKLPELDPASVAPTVEVIPFPLTLTDQGSVDALVSKVRDEQGGCDVLINNAGVYYYDTSASREQRKEMYETNFYGTMRVCQAFLPLMRKGGRIVNLSSQSGQLKYMAPHLRKLFLEPDLTLNQVGELLSKYEQAVAAREAARRGWPTMAYFPSKAALNSGTRILARDNPDLLINCCCPGWVATDLGGQAGPPPKTPEQGAEIPLHLAFGNIGKTSGRYWANDSVADTGTGRVRPW
ncbi:putative short-chain dehydrogenase reductase SDR [Rosellinia necatrix]|uniref:Putative short-chain dehydrogenase reductase SDR n=1 Tax=Rosellinia necatrix TaxID=77044 RepID=A0A1S7UHM6_ROSNE|nr:putative short-chain dehydrogenase reductase SDR [Rosellinia necatrix]